MFYLTNDSGRFIAVRGDVNTFLVTVWDGSVMRGVSGKKELLCKVDPSVKTVFQRV